MLRRREEEGERERKREREREKEKRNVCNLVKYTRKPVTGEGQEVSLNYV